MLTYTQVTEAEQAIESKKVELRKVGEALEKAEEKMTEFSGTNKFIAAADHRNQLAKEYNTVREELAELQNSVLQYVNEQTELEDWCPSQNI